MPLKNTPEVVRFYRVALQRFEDAEILLANKRTTGALYLAGYAVECTLKFLLLANEPVARHRLLVASFRGKIGHDFEWLKQALAHRGVIFPPTILKSFRRVVTWTTELRYNPVKKSLREAQEFLNAATQVIAWAERKL